MSIYKSIAKNYAANVFGMGVNFLNQIAMVPLFISLWGVTKYADWILITALSSFFTMTNVGLNTVTTNEFVIKYQQKDFATCTRLLTNAFFFVVVVGGLLLLLAVFVAFVWGFQGLLNTTVFTNTETSATFILVLFNVFVKMYGGIYGGIYNAVSKNYFNTIVQNILRLMELIVLFLGILLKVDIIPLIVVYNIPALAGVIFNHIYTHKWFDAVLSVRNFDKDTFKAMLKPSVAFMLMPLSYAVSNQGLVFVVNALLGPVVLVAFTTTRTLVNFLRSLMGFLATAIWPEISAAYGRNDKKTITNIYYRSVVITFVTTLAGIIALLFVGKPIYLMWTKHAIMFNEVFFIGMLFVLLVSCLWGLSSVIPLATNTHGWFTIAFLVSQVTGVVLCYACLKIEPHIAIIPFALFLIELALFVYTLTKNNQFLETNFKQMTSGLWTQAKFLIVRTNSLRKKIRLNQFS
jgi:O-antigen/teichoic acid export membrane protein